MRSRNISFLSSTTISSNASSSSGSNSSRAEARHRVVACKESTCTQLRHPWAQLMCTACIAGRLCTILD